MSKVYIPQDYHTPLSVYEMQRAIEFIKSNFQVNLGQALNLRRVSAPLFVEENSGLNDNLNGVERPVSFDIPDVGATGQVVARALRFFGADVTYYSRSHKPEIEAESIAYLPLDELLQKNICVCTCLNKFVTLLHQEEFEKLGNHKILFNTGLTPACDLDALRTWLSHGDNYYFCDSLMALGDESLKEVENVSCYGGYSGGSYQAIERLTEKSLANLDQFLAK